MKFNINKNGNRIKTISAKYMDSVWNQFNKYAKSKGCTHDYKPEAIGALVWITPSDEVLELVKVED